MHRISFILVLSLLSCISFGQYSWKLQKNKNGIKIYLSETPNSDLKAIKAECEFAGNYSKLISIVSDVSQFNSWVYNSKNCRILKQISPNDFIYYTETYLPWPISNRDAIIHMQIKTDSLPRLLTITGSSEPALVPGVPDIIRVIQYKAYWKITMPTDKTIHIDYIAEINPGGNIPAWIINSFSDKGPFETFNSLSEKLKK
jgi:hypothetical protein